ncbi:NOL1/NOP2/sun family putative RNA methylase [Butyrivibrio proteoclasticus]|uniref:NOL1/NOP2/sun family putative RNA methylase n=1 Tax=Butyrivibrio proteoclasticus TaxID=43305 RepID=A0A1I5UBZ3_9FIRM|nr:RsmF rRNA methyltransferase first C-terminal domain-containing protein [Butyrivibrio proteoclasticus]SFP92762.1 NOL1/NOP2/sun family putative RNA methylase [Butyrivibrio proteoclasticus]
MIPVDFKERMKLYLGEKEYDEFISSFDNDERYNSLRINTLKCDKADLKSKLLYIEKEVPWEANGYYYENAQPGKHPYHEAGLYYVQEPSAMAPVHFLDPRPGEKILDLCAAPGGKTTQIASYMDGEGILVTNEINRDRAKILSLNVERLGIKNALVLNEDSAHLSEVFEGYFEKILVDAPCSGEGMFRKNDNAGDEWSLDNVRACAVRQKEILSNAAKMLLPGGRLVYSTCTFSADENEETVFDFLFNNPDFHTIQVAKVGGIESGRVEFISDEFFDKYASIDKERAEKCRGEVSESLRLWPHKLKGEGHFLCVFERDGSLSREKNNTYVPGGKNIPAKPEAVRIFEVFVKETLAFDKKSFEIKRGRIFCKLSGKKNLNGLIYMFGDQLYLCPEDMPSVNGLKVMRGGLHLGTVKKDRFEPSHALALFLTADDVCLNKDYASDSLEIKSYLNGQTMKITDDIPDSAYGQVKKDSKGWALITTDGYSIGWAKAAGGMLKNHYPKGLRINY